MVRPRVARGFIDLESAVLHQCIRSLIGALAPDHHGYQRACDLISGQASNRAIRVTSVRVAGKTDLHFVSSSRRPRQVKLLATSSIAPHLACAVPLFVPGGRSFVPTCEPRTRRAQVRSRLAVAQASPLASMLPGHALTAPSTAQGLR